MNRFELHFLQMLVLDQERDKYISVMSWIPEGPWPLIQKAKAKGGFIIKQPSITTSYAHYTAGAGDNMWGIELLGGGLRSPSAFLDNNATGVLSLDLNF